jgi:hypothetical protein
MPSDATLLTRDQAAFLAGPVGISVASHDESLRPSLSRACGCKVSSDCRRVFIYVVKAHAQALLSDIGAGRPVAAVFSRPRTHETLQLKGPAGRVRPLTQADRTVLQASCAAFVGEIAALGFSEAFIDAYLTSCRGEAACIAFTPTAIFDQTPGPRAGMRLESRI